MSRRRSDVGDEIDLDVERLVRTLGVELRGRGTARGGSCPFHPGEANPPTLTVDRKVNTWTCPACAPGGASAIDFVRRAEGISRRAAIDRIRSGEPLTGAALQRGRRGRGEGLVEHTTVRALDPEFAVDADETLLTNVAAFYHRMLAASPEALAWLDKRGLGSSELVQAFRLGYANRTLGLRLPKANRKAGNDVRNRLQRLGIIRASGHEHFNGCVVFPVLDGAGRIAQIYGRKITPGLRAGTPLHVYLHDDRRGLFNPGAFDGKTVILTEGIIDALTFWADGHRNVTCTFGTRLTPDVRGALAEHQIERVLVAYDRDAEGDAGAEAIASELGGLGLEVLRVVFPAGMDANDFARTSNDPAEAFARLVRHPEWLAGCARTNVAKARQPSSSSPATPPEAVAHDGDELVLQLGDLRWRVRGLAANRAPGTMRLNVMVSREGVGFHVDVLDLYASRHRAAFTRLASEELCVDETTVRKDLGRLLLASELAQDERLRRQQETLVATAPEMTDEDRRAALDLLRDPRLLDRVLDDLERLGMVAERDNLLLAYLVATSRKLPRPLALVVQSSPAAGKSSLLDAVLSLVPEEERVSYSTMTGQSLYYMGGAGLRGKVLAIAEEEGAAKASYALKLLQSDGALTIASTGKDAGTGRLVSQEYRVEGPVALMMTTTAIDVNEELLSRCLVVAVDESPEQTARILAWQRWAQSLEGLLARNDREPIVRAHRNAQRLLRPMKVVNPFASEMAFADLRVQGRRDQRKLLGLVEALALLHQHQRPVKTIERDDHVIEYVEVERGDIEIAERLLCQAGGPRIDDLPPQTARLLVRLDEMVRSGRDDREQVAAIRFSRREVRERLGVGDAQSKVHLRRLVEAEFLLAHRAPHGRGVVYSLAFQPDDAGARDRVSAGHGWGSGGPRVGVGRPSGGPSKTPTETTRTWVANDLGSDGTCDARLGNPDESGRTRRSEHQREGAG